MNAAVINEQGTGSWWQDPGRLPVLGRAIRRWRMLILANRGARREAKAALFAELAEAARHGMPLDLALAMNSQSLRELRRGATPAHAPGANSRYRLADFLYGAAMYLFAQFALVLYTLFSFRVVDVERISRLLALRLHQYVSKGLPLSEAMRRCSPDYDDQEVRLIEAGEQWNAVPQALKRLAEFQVTEQRLSAIGAQLLYPVWLLFFLSLVTSFIMVFIIPKFKDIFDQLGAELPWMTQTAVNVSYILFGNVLGFLPAAIMILLALFVVLRAVMNGNRLTKIVLFAPVFMVLLFGFPAFVELISESQAGKSLLQDALTTLVLFFGVLLLVAMLVILVVPELFWQLEKTVLSIERRHLPIVRRLPLLGAAARAEEEARWLATLAVALESGVPAPDAFRSAGRVCGGALEGRSERGAQLVAGGESIGAACVAARVLRPEINHRLVLLDSYDDYLDGLRTVSEDAAQGAFEITARVGRVMAVVSIVLMGIVVGVFALAMYMPLFEIPGAVMYGAAAR